MRARRLLAITALAVASLAACSGVLGIKDVGPFHDAAPDNDVPEAPSPTPTPQPQPFDAGDASDSCADGSVAIDPENCGACGHSCLGGACDSGICQPVDIVKAEAHAGAIAVDDAPDGWVYWAQTVSNGGSVNRIRKDGGADTRALLYEAVGDEDLFANIVLTPTRLYWPQLGFSTGAVHGANLDGTGHQKLILQYGVGAVASDSTQLFAVNRFESDVIVRAPYDFSDSTGLYSEDVRSGDSFMLAVDHAPGNGVYWIGGGLHRMDKDGSNYAKLWPFGDLWITVDDKSIYFDRTAGETSILKMGRDGTCPATATQCPEVLAVFQNNPVSLTVDGNYLYWVTTADNTLMRVNKDGTGLVTLLSGLDLPCAMAVDDRAIYWVEQGSSNRIRKLAK
jgi:hypothetical protein